ncbi:Predicted AAA-ATPase [Fusobacterium necrogenes]|uniref:Predicted AAA-ATPase n=1 Tax=Fusobacterium necrogenes TaxID=858 RepID=A0A377GW87_9FUSO|nr:AAA family ATPase [Fusobacterium necrogenes]STO30811.1 Predicted AAA-ATPase [Fusobacterium necrogenes]
MLKGLPIGVEDFKKIRETNCYYIDKTKLIEDLLIDKTEVKLFCRPRRFGKTLSMSTLRYFFDIKNKEENRKLFDGLYISNSPMMSEQGKYPVIFISMKGITSSNWSEAIKNISEKIFKLYNQFDGIINSNFNEVESKKFQRLLSQESGQAEMQTALSFLTSLLYKYYNRKVILLIDEYDSPILSAVEKSYYTEMKDFLRAFYGDALKTNEYLQMGVLTGIIRVTQAGIFSDLNNIENYTILKKSYSQYFGLLEAEVEEALRYYGIEYKLDEVRAWYDGYNFVGTEVYNPLSILKYIKEKELESYWINTSGNALIMEIIANSDDRVIKDLEKLFEEKELETTVDLELDMGKSLLESDIWSLMLSSGYLTIKEKIDRKNYIIKIPNKEIRTFFKDAFIKMVFRGTRYVNDVKRALLTKDLESFEIAFQNMVLESISFHNTTLNMRKEEGKEVDELAYSEVPYQMFMLGFLTSMQDKFYVTPEQESGLGRADILLEPKNKNGVEYILEIKATRKNSRISNLAKRAHKQIDSKIYETELRKRGVIDIVKIGIAFRGKEVEFHYE